MTVRLRQDPCSPDNREPPTLPFEEIRVTLTIAGLADDGFLMRNEILRTGKLCAKVTSSGGWLDLAVRKLVLPPAALLAALRSLPQTADFAVLPSLARA